MNVEFTNQEYEALMHMVCLAGWMLHSTEEEEADDVYSAIEQKIYSHAKDFACGGLVEFHADHNHFHPTDEFEMSEEIQDAIDNYNNENFWDELVGRLAVRDLLKKHGEKKLDAMSPEDRARMIADEEDIYEKEFESHGLDRLEIGTSAPGGPRRR